MEAPLLLVNLYWSLLILAFGACVGSFLNVIIYRWPRDLSIRRPVWSFCPMCEGTIRFRDNIPIVSYLLLRGRCRDCRAPISLQYPLVEAATALTFLIAYHALFVAKLRTGITDLGADWPILLAHWALCAGLIALAVMDLEAYMVDIRITWLITLAGLVGHAGWTPATSAWDGGWIRPGATQAAVALAAAVGLAIGALIFLRGPADESDTSAAQAGPTPSVGAEPRMDTDGYGAGERSAAPAMGAPPEGLPQSQIEALNENETPSAPAGEGPARHRRWILALVPVLLVLGYLAVMVWQEQRALQEPTRPLRVTPGVVARAPEPWMDPQVVTIALGLVALFAGLALVASQPQPEADAEIVEAIDAEAPDSRRNSLWELGLLAPAIVLMLAVGLVLHHSPRACTWVHDALHWQPAAQWRALSGWQPLWGLATALSGWIIGGAIGWGMRIIFTLGLGKEALGMGDVHIMAATGAVAGWCVALVGFFVAAPLALLAMVVIYFRRQSRALPYGPWLGLAFFVVIIFQDRILDYLHISDLLRTGALGP